MEDEKREKMKTFLRPKANVYFQKIRKTPLLKDYNKDLEEQNNS